MNMKSNRIVCIFIFCGLEFLNIYLKKKVAFQQDQSGMNTRYRSLSIISCCISCVFNFAFSYVSYYSCESVSSSFFVPFRIKFVNIVNRKISFFIIWPAAALRPTEVRAVEAEAKSFRGSQVPRNASS